MRFPMNHKRAQKLGIYVYCPGDPPANVGLLGLVYGPSGEVAAVPPSSPGKSEFLRLIELANEAIALRHIEETGGAGLGHCFPRSHCIHCGCSPRGTKASQECEG